MLGVKFTRYRYVDRTEQRRKPKSKRSPRNSAQKKAGYDKESLNHAAKLQTQTHFDLVTSLWKAYLAAQLSFDHGMKTI